MAASTRSCTNAWKDARLISNTALIADIGATNARFALLENGSYHSSAILPCIDHLSLNAAVEVFFRQAGVKERPRRAALAIAGPISGDVLRMTNHPWTISVSETRSKLGFDQLEVVNDFAALAHAIPRLDDGHRLQIGTGEALTGHPVAVIGPGTGLGMASLVPVKDAWRVLAGEGGHATAAPADEREAAVIAVLRRQYDHVSVERLVSGMGLTNLRDALALLHGEDPPGLVPAEITDAAQSGGDPLSVEAVDLFCALLGGAAGNVALTLGARGGVYIAGGIVPKLGEMFFRSRFRERFTAKGRMSAFLEPIPTYLITHPLPAFLGLAALLDDRSEEKNELS